MTAHLSKALSMVPFKETLLKQRQFSDISAQETNLEELSTYALKNKGI